jgi:S1-C subfamily serine protease
MAASTTDFLRNLSDAIAERVQAAAPALASIRGKWRGLNAIVWRAEVIVTSEQALSDRAGYTLTLPGGAEIEAAQGGRDPGTNVAILRPAKPLATSGLTAAADPRVGDVALIVGSGAGGGPTAQFSIISELGPAWHSETGGRIDRLIRLDLRAGRGAEGGLVIDTAGGVLGMAAAGPRGRMLVIPHATIERTLDPLVAEGRVARGWLGLGMQPVMVPAALREVVGQAQGRMIVAVAPGGPAEQAGLMPGDILLSLDGQELAGHRAIRAFLGPESVGTSVQVRLLRGGQLQSVGLTIAARPPG